MVYLGMAAALLTLYLNLAGAGYEKRLRLKLVAALIISVLAGWCFANLGNWFTGRLIGLPLQTMIRNAGFSWYPGLLGGVLAYFLIILLMKQNIREVMNITAPGLPLGHALGRIGCAIAGCCYGAETDFLLFGIHFSRIPTQLAEAAFGIVLFLLLQFVIKKRRPSVYAYSYAVFRFIIEFFRADNRGTFIPGIPGSPAQQIAVIFVIVTTIVILALHVWDKHKADILRRSDYEK